MKFREFFLTYWIGSVGYRFIEILWRGYTHWSMGILGGLCFLCIARTEARLPRHPTAVKAALCTCLITLLEFCTGVIVNLGLHMDVWDYSSLRFNILGQISLLYSIFWFFLCIPALKLCKLLRHRVFGALPSGKRHHEKILERQPSIR